MTLAERVAQRLRERADGKWDILRPSTKHEDRIVASLVEHAPGCDYCGGCGFDDDSPCDHCAEYVAALRALAAALGVEEERDATD